MRQSGGRRVSTSALRLLSWGSGVERVTEYRGTLTTVVPDVWTGIEAVREFDAYFHQYVDGSIRLAVMNEREPR